MRILIAIALLLATTATARAQTCIGKTFSPGSIAVGVRGSVGDSFSSLGGGLAGY